MNHEELEAQLHKLEQRIAALEAFCALQQQGLEKARLLLDMHQHALEGLSGYRPPDPAKAVRN